MKFLHIVGSAFVLSALACGGDAASDSGSVAAADKGTASSKIASPAASSSASTTPEEVIQEQVVVLNDIAKQVESIDSKDDVEAAKPKLRALADDLKAARDRWEGLLADGVSQEDLDAAIKDSKALMKAGTRIEDAFKELATNPSLLTSLPALVSEFGDIYKTN